MQIVSNILFTFFTSSSFSFNSEEATEIADRNEGNEIAGGAANMRVDCIRIVEERSTWWVHIFDWSELFM